MLIDADLSQLEWRVGAELSKDETMIKEIINGLDIHTENSINLFGDAKFRQESKTISFRSLYGGSAYAFFMDSRMPSKSLKEWEDIVNAFYKKYKGLKKWQDDNYKYVIKNGYLISPTGRKYIFKKYRKKDGSWEYSRPAVCNYPVQGTATADIVPLAMYHINKIINDYKLQDKILIINQVHDSIILDTINNKKIIDTACSICYDVFNDLPRLIREWFKIDWIVPLTGECKFGPTWADMELWKP